MERDSGRYGRLSSSLGRVVSLAVLCIVSSGWLAAGVAHAATPPSNSQLPTITGSPVQGSVLTADPGTWSGDAPISFSYQWSDGQTGSSDTLSSVDLGKAVTVTVTAVNAAGQASATSASVGPVLPLPPVDTTAPGISGTAQQGATLTVNNGVWSNNPTAYSYVWQDCSSPGVGCAAISGATSSTYTLQASDVGKLVSVTVTASNSGGQTSVTTASVGPVLPPAPANEQAPVISGTAEQGDTLSVSNGTWTNSPSGFSYAWENCNSVGSNCIPIGGATSSSYALSAADVGSTIVCVVTAIGTGGRTSVGTARTAVVVASPIPAASQPTTTELLMTPAAPVTNQGVTLIATVTAATSSTALWGTVTFENQGAVIGSCTGMRVSPSGQSATVACSTSFAASTAELSATFTPTTGSVLKASVSATAALAVAPDTSSTSLNASPSVNVRASTTYTATVAPPAARPGPVQPTGSVEFLDGGVPISTCVRQPLANGAATCTVNYTAQGPHSITAVYSGDVNFTASSSPAAQISVARAPISVMGAITSTMQWAFYYTPRYTLIRNLVVNAASPGATVVVKCSGRGCPFAKRATLLTTRMKCRSKAATMCFTLGSFNITPVFAGRRLAVGTRIAVSIIQPNWIGKSYSFTVRARRAPRIQIGCLAPGGSRAGVGC